MCAYKKLQTKRGSCVHGVEDVEQISHLVAGARAGRPRAAAGLQIARRALIHSSKAREIKIWGCGISRGFVEAILQGFPPLYNCGRVAGARVWG